MAADEATAILVIGTLWLVFVIFKDLFSNSRKDLFFLKPLGYTFILFMGIGTLNYAVAINNGVGATITNGLQTLYVAYIPVIMLFAGFMFLIMLMHVFNVFKQRAEALRNRRNPK